MKTNLVKAPVKLIAIDMDGTLLRSDKTVDPRTGVDIQAALDHGVLSVFCTGRGIAEMDDIFAALPMVRYAICCSGAVIYDRADDRFIYSSGIRQPQIGRIMETAGKYAGMPHFLTEKESIAAAADVCHMADFQRGVYQPLFEAQARQVADMSEEAKRHSVIAKLNIYFRTQEDRIRGREDLSGEPLQLTFSEDATLEMTAPGTDKGSGLKQLADHLRIPMEQTAAIGDNYNDSEMLSAAGFSVAMGNAIPAIRERCDHITADNDRNGAGEAIRFILQNNPE